MATLEERVRKQYSEVSYEDCNKVTEISMSGLQSIKRECYMKGATDQRKIDVGKAFTLVNEILKKRGFHVHMAMDIAMSIKEAMMED